MKPALREELLNLPLPERLELVQDLWDSIAADCEGQVVPLTARSALALTQAQREDLERRLAEADAHPLGGTPWQEARERIRHR